MVTRLLSRGYEARLHHDPYLPDIYHYTVSLVGHPQILAWGQETTLQRAEAAAEECIRDFVAAGTRAA